jgi:hypothetical protein
MEETVEFGNDLYRNQSIHSINQAIAPHSFKKGKGKEFLG